MDKPSQTKPYAGLVIYRIQRNVEYLLLNDSFTNKKHWFCPKGQVIGNEDEIKCALRETYENTGLRPTDLRIEEGFAIELKYLSGTKPKRVKYHLAQLVDNHVRLLSNAEGVHMQWFSQPTCFEKVVFKSMQDVFKHAQTFIEAKQQRRKLAYENRHNSNGNNHALSTAGITMTPPATVTPSNNCETKSSTVPVEDTKIAVNKPRQQSPPQQPQQQSQQQASPLYKTRLCERFETEGSCPYGSKCNFAHGVVELRGKETQLQHSEDRPATAATTANQSVDSGNQLFKTRLCEKFMKEKFCQYGPKCHFAHGENELKTRPKKAEDEVKEARINNHRRYNENNDHSVNTPDYAEQPQQRTSWRSGNQYPSDAYGSRSSETSWRSNNNNNYHHNGDISRSATTTASARARSSSSEEDTPVYVPGRSNRDTWRSTTPSSPKTPPPMHTPISPPKAASSPSPAPVVVGLEKEEIAVAQEPVIISTVVDELRRPAFVEHQTRTSPSAINNSGNNSMKKAAPKEKKAMVAPVTTEKSWMKVVKLTKEEQDEMEINSTTKTKATCSPGKLAQTELIISDLKKFFTNNTPTTVKGKLSDDVKEVTKIEMRNDLSKKQLLYILIVSLFEDMPDPTSANMLVILKARNPLFNTFVKSNADQMLLLKAWEKFVNDRKPIMVSKTAAVLSHWYDCEMVEEEAFVQWYDTLQKESPLEKKSAKFIEWLNTSDDEDDDE